MERQSIRSHDIPSNLDVASRRDGIPAFAQRHMVSEVSSCAWQERTVPVFGVLLHVGSCGRAGRVAERVGY
jgi:hypothetical protein